MSIISAWVKLLVLTGLGASSLLAQPASDVTTQEREFHVRIYIPGPAINRSTGGAVVVESSAKTGVRLDRVLVSVQSEKIFRQSLNSGKPSPPNSEVFDGLVVTYENEVVNARRNQLGGPVRRPQIISIEGTTLTKVAIEGSPLETGDVKLRAYLLRDGKLVAGSDPVSIRCVESK